MLSLLHISGYVTYFWTWVDAVRMILSISHVGRGGMGIALIVTMFFENDRSKLWASDSLITN